ncbi:hypothetical protein Hanom_Chr04g00324661 [Helianthus anomalus]
MKKCSTLYIHPSTSKPSNLGNSNLQILVFMCDRSDFAGAMIRSSSVPSLFNNFFVKVVKVD